MPFRHCISTSKIIWEKRIINFGNKSLSKLELLVCFLTVLFNKATASSSKRKAPTHVVDSGSDTNESTDLEESDSDSCDVEDESESENNIDEDLDHIKGYSTKRTGQLFVSKIM